MKAWLFDSGFLILPTSVEVPLSAQRYAFIVAAKEHNVEPVTRVPQESARSIHKLSRLKR
jgi:hypothetical protein